MKPLRFGPLSYSQSTDMDRTVILMHHLALKLWRGTFEFRLQTQASVDRMRRMDAYCAARAEAAKVWSPLSVSWALEDLDGTTEEAIVFLQCVAKGLIDDPWPDTDA